MPDCSSWAAWITLSLLTTVSPMTYHRNSQPSHVTPPRGEPQAAPRHVTNLTFLPAQSKRDEELMATFPSLEESDIMGTVVSCGTRPESVPTPPFGVFNLKFGRFDSQTFLFILSTRCLDFPSGSPEDIWNGVLASSEPMHVTDHASAFWHSGFDCMLIPKLL